MMKIIKWETHGTHIRVTRLRPTKCYLTDARYDISFYVTTRGATWTVCCTDVTSSRLTLELKRHNIGCGII